MHIKPSYFPFIHYKLHQLVLANPIPFYFNLLKFQAIWTGSRYNSEPTLSELTLPKSLINVKRWILMQSIHSIRVNVLISKTLFKYFELHLNLVWICESLCIFFHNSNQWITVFNIVCANQSRWKWNHCHLLIWRHMNISNLRVFSFIFRCHQFMSSNEQCFILSHLEYPNQPFIVTTNYHCLSRIDSHRCQSKVLSRLFMLLSLKY
jgi:hypothetical protein